MGCLASLSPVALVEDWMAFDARWLKPSTMAVGRCGMDRLAFLLC
jgi:hypothetical protein